jgi:hypothetical protein
MIFKSRIVKAHWDNWCYYHDGVYYLYYLITEHSPGEGIGVATSRDGVHWEDHGWTIKASDKMVTYLGTGAVWQDPAFAQTKLFLCNYSEWRIEPDTGKQTQNILFAYSTDLIHWTKYGDDFIFRVDDRYYDKYGRWDCIYPMPRAEGGYWGTWTATAHPDSPHQGTIGIGYSEDGLHWRAMDAPYVSPGVDESGAFWPFGDRIYAMFGHGGNMFGYAAETVDGPYAMQPVNGTLFAKGHTYFARFFPLPDGQVLVNHQSNSEWGWHIATLKRAIVDAHGVLRIEYWPGNDALKGAPVSVSPNKLTDAVTMMIEAQDFDTGLFIEGSLDLSKTTEDYPAGFFIQPDKGQPHALKIFPDHRVEFGPMDPATRDWKPVLITDRSYPFASSVFYTVLVRRGMLELYLDGQLIECYCMQGCGGSTHVSVGALGEKAEMGAWVMTV